jgi:serine/threonine protein phosphatase PrpC
MEIYANSRPQDGRTTNEDAFLIGRGQIPYAALCDGSGAAGQVAKSVLKIFESQIGHATVEEIERFPTWTNWTHLLDSAILGGPQSTFLAVAFLNNRIVGVCTGDTRLYFLPAEGELQILTEEAPKYRLGSGKVVPFAIHRPVKGGDILLLMSDGAWTPLNLSTLGRLRGRISSVHFSEFPSVILDEAGKFGKADDMTVMAMRI